MIRTIHSEIVRYELLEFLGEGAMAQVYRAARADSRGYSRQLVAVKILKSQNRVHHLIQEMEALMKVRSVHCVSLIGWENLSEGPALVMEWVEGVSLRALVRSGPLDEDLTKEIAAQVQLGLWDLKRCGLSHGDLSLSNILIDKTGCVRLVDFGLSGPESGKTIIGTPQFLSPERWAGGPPSYESDLYSLGLILMDLNSKRPLEGAALEYWRERSFQAAQNEGLLARDSKLRTKYKFESDEVARRRLASRVVDLMNSNKGGPETLLTPSPKNLVTSSRGLSIAILMTLLLFFPVRPYGISSWDTLLESAKLEIRPNAWVRVWLNGKDVGYSPIKAFSVRPGRHEMKWESKLTSGSGQFSVSYGEHKILRDDFFFGGEPKHTFASPNKAEQRSKIRR